VNKTNEDVTECSETSAHTIRTLGIRPKERTQYSKHSESLKSRSFSGRRKGSEHHHHHHHHHRRRRRRRNDNPVCLAYGMT